uniref:DUF659 domain-containing protein n=1 Tax=Amphimedon queenslandica TaxID=400682 RepID=A0A1X7TGF3_AMPQE
MSASFLGVTAHFFTLNSNKRHSICIALKRFLSPHTGTQIAELLQNIVDGWELSRKKLFRVLTDNGSNTDAAFKKTNNEDDSIKIESDESDDIRSTTPGEIEELFIGSERNELDNIETNAGSDITNFEVYESDHHYAFVGLCDLLDQEESTTSEVVEQSKEGEDANPI